MSTPDHTETRLCGNQPSLYQTMPIPEAPMSKRREKSSSSAPRVTTPPRCTIPYRNPLDNLVSIHWCHYLGGESWNSPCPRTPRSVRRRPTTHTRKWPIFLGAEIRCWESRVNKPTIFQVHALFLLGFVWLSGHASAEDMARPVELTATPHPRDTAGPGRVPTDCLAPHRSTKESP